jgi:hypothetical protein
MGVDVGTVDFIELFERLVACANASAWVNADEYCCIFIP